jgi:CubicO group peptidase (beta-lactamase class C family)
VSAARRFAVALAIAIVASPAIARAQQKPDLKAFDAYVAHAAHEWRVPGMAISIVKDDSLVFAKGYGVIQIGKPAPATEHTRFAIGSTTKAMTTAALAMLVDEGKLHWDDRLIDLLPDFQLYDAYATHEMTVRDLLTHRSGLPGTDLLWVIPENNVSTAEMMRRLRYVKPISSFRSHWEYQNVVYSIAGLLIERISGMPWQDFVRKRIFTPLGMNETVPLVSEVLSQPNVAVPHDIVNDTVAVVPVRTTDAVASAGSVWSSVSDMSKWMRFMLDSGRVGTKQLIQPATFAEIVAPQIRAPMEEYPALELSRPRFFSYAFGWFVEEYHGHTIWMHTGSIDGMCALIALEPDKKLGVYVLENLDHAELRHALMFQVLDMFDGGNVKSHRDWSKDLLALFNAKRAERPSRRNARAATADSAAPASLPLDRYAGTYTDSTYGTVTVTEANGALHARFDKWGIGELVHGTYEEFHSKVRDPLEGITQITFVPDGQGHTSALRFFGETFPRDIPRADK